jgi:hypothetical protein
MSDRQQTRLSRRSALGALGAGSASVAGCAASQQSNGGSTEGPSQNATGAPTDRSPAALDERSGVHYVTSASEMNEALRALPENGGIVKWRPGSYTGEAFTEMVEIPTGHAHKSINVTLDMTSVDITIRPEDPYQGEDGAFFYKPPGERSTPVNIFGPHRLQIEGTLDDVDPTSGRIAADDGEENSPFQDEDPAPHVFYLYDTGSCTVAPHVVAPHTDRILYFRQNSDCGHHVHTKGFRSWGGRVGIQVSDQRDECGKDRCHWWGQIGGYLSTAVHLAGKAKSNRVWAQPEGAKRDAAEKHAAAFRIENQMNSIMLTHIAGEGQGHTFDIQARNCGIFAPCTDGNPQPFKHARLGVRPSNIYKPNYTAQVLDMGLDYRSNLSLVEDGDGTVEYDGRDSELVLRADSGRAGVQTPGQVGRMGHHLHGYADARIRGAEPGNANGEFRFGAWVDEDNHAMLTYDPSGDVPLGATIRSGGERVDTADNVLTENVDVGGTAAPASWIAYVRADYQAFFHDYSLVYEGYHDLTGWPQDPRLRADHRALGSEEAVARVHRLEYGDARKAEDMEELISGLNRGFDQTIERPWRHDDVNIW